MEIDISDRLTQFNIHLFVLALYMQTAMNSNAFFVKNQEFLKMLPTAWLLGLAGGKRVKRNRKFFTGKMEYDIIILTIVLQYFASDRKRNVVNYISGHLCGF